VPIHLLVVAYGERGDILGAQSCIISGALPPKAAIGTSETQHILEERHAHMSLRKV
jgi:hypothetical protein